MSQNGKEHAQPHETVERADVRTRADSVSLSPCSLLSAHLTKRNVEVDKKDSYLQFTVIVYLMEA